MKKYLFVIANVFLIACQSGTDQTEERLIVDSLSELNAHSFKDTIIKAEIPEAVEGSLTDHARKKPFLPPVVSRLGETGNVSPEEVVGFAQTLIGVPYVWASTDPEIGFDCSGFITYVFHHFNIEVPRSSVDFTNIGRTIPQEEAQKGDFILFRGTNPQDSVVGHMGLIVSNQPEALSFIHATSGKAMSVTISKLSESYKKRFVRISRIFR